MKNNVNIRMFLLIFLLIIAMVSDSFAEVNKKENYFLEKEHAVKFIQSLGEEAEFSGRVKELYNYKGKIEAVLFELTETDILL